MGPCLSEASKVVERRTKFLAIYSHHRLMPVRERLWINMSPVQQTFVTLIPTRTVNIEQSSLDGIDRSNKHPSLLVNAGVDGPFRGL